MDNSYSVLMSVYKKENPRYFKEAINSMLQQTIPPNDFVLVCDGPLTEGLNEVVAEFQHTIPDIFQVIRLEQNVGLGKALQIGIKNCKNELIARMDSDDISVKSRCEQQLKCFDNDKTLDVCSGSIAEFEHNITNIIAFRQLPCEDEKIKKFAKRRNPINHMAVMYRKKAVLDAGNYQELPLAEDYFLWARMLMKKKKFKNLESILVYARIDNGMFKRRGGIRYVKSILILQKKLKRIGFISARNYIENCVIRCSIALVPEKMRAYFYKKRLRSKLPYITEVKDVYK